MKHLFLQAILVYFFAGAMAQGVINNGAHLVLTNNSHLVIDGNYVNQNNGQLNMDGDVWLSGNFENNATVNAIAGADASNTLHMNGDVTQAFTGIYAGVLTLESLSIESGALAELAAGQQMTLKGDFTGNGTFTLLSDATGTASFIVEGSVTGDATAQLYLAETVSGDPHWHYATLPIDVSGGDITGSIFGTPYPHNGDYYAAYWDETLLDYTPIDNGTTVLNTNLRGYAVPKQAAETISFTGTLLNGNQQADFTRQPSGTSAGYNLAGNPYTSGIDLKTIGTTNSVPTNLESTVWIKNDLEFITYNWTSGASTDPEFTGVVPAMQGVWFRVAESSTTGSIQFAADDQTHANNGVYKTSKNNVLRLQIAGENNSDRTVIGFYDEASDDLDAFDSEKIFATSTDKPQLYSIVDNKKMAINGLKNTQDDTRIVPLSITIPGEGLYTISVSNIAEFDLYDKVILEDRQNGNITDLKKQSEYAFTSALANNDPRFNIIFGKMGSTDIDDIVDNMQIYAYNQELYIRSNDHIHGILTIVDALGKTMLQKDIHAGAGLYQTPANLQPGVYVVKITNGQQVQTEKIIISGK